MAPEIWKTFPPVRRVVTGHDANGVAKVLIDAPATNAKGTEGRSTLMWITEQNPADMAVGEKIEDMGARIVGTPPPPNGTRFCVIDFPPGNHPHMHRTETIDYVIVIDGEIEMDMDELDGEAEGRRHHGPARHLPRLGQPQRQERPCCVCAGGRKTARHRHAGARHRQRALNRRMIMPGIRIAIAAVVTALALAGAANAQTYPNAQVRLIVPTSPGGVTDTMARIVAQRLTEQLGQAVIVDNRAGGNGSVGAIAVARAPTDGLTLLVTSDATITANPSLSGKLGYSAKDFTPIIVLCRGTPVLVVNGAVPANNVKELIALAKAKPGTLNYGSYGVGTYAHLSMEEFKQRTGTDIVHIPYRGASPAAQALLAGDVSMLLLNYSSIAEHEKTGKVKILAAAGDKRAQVRPELPTIAEAGVPGFSTTVWFALFGPANMPADLVAKIHADVSKVLDLPQSKEFFEKNSFERVTDSPAEFAKLVEHNSQHWDALIKQVGAKVD